MSYILEALKKAQAERQLGSSPTIHAPTLHAADRASPVARVSKPLLLSLGGMAVVIGVLLVLVWRSPASAPTPRQTPAPAVASASPSPPAVVAVSPTPLPAPVADLPPSVANLARASASTPQPVALAAPAPGLASAKPVAAPEEPVVNLRDLPEPIQRSIPQVSVGGYIYSRNAADRVLLIDKILRREGDEVAPGLILEKLQPKEAVFNFKGYRYRVPY
ncbi:general secretion pathway protein GspB [Duganella sp. BuS-21]|uniref:general secretion pathway protein GspB n=1 Tax=Duganella sp. BuS-21 TaxID=2943848 RepID=UPI0035A6CE38